MCGITGFYDTRIHSSYEDLVKMTDVLTHRGPDDVGYELIQNDSYQLGLGQRRLSILDLSPLGHQPMKYNDWIIVFNGEIYNFTSIRDELITLGYNFKSNSDTEVLIKSFDKWGVEAIHKFIGMFAFAIYNQQSEKLWLVRDRAGVKPLFYYWRDGLLLFGSELKSFHKHPGFQKEIDKESMAMYLQYGYVPFPHCIFKYAQKLEPGNFILFDLKNKGEYRKESYWSVQNCYNQPKLDITYEDAQERLTDIFDSSFKYRMVSDVPVGVFLSGGYDSSCVAGLLQTRMSKKLKTFTIGFHEKGFDEASYASQIANFLGTEHTEYYCTPKEAREIIPILPEIYDEPFGDNSVIPTILVSRLARKDVSVALSADGGDEIFAGYDKFNHGINFTANYPIWLQGVLSGIMDFISPEFIPHYRNQYNFPTRYEKMRLIWKHNSPVIAMKLIAQLFTEKELREMITADFVLPKTSFDSEASFNDSNDSLNKMLAVDYLTFLVDNNLNKVDRATMSVALEGREPLLDHRILEFVSRLPSEYKIRNGVNKAILKDVVHSFIPKEIMDRPKMPFIAPISHWFKKDLTELFLYYLSYERLNKEGLLNAKPIIELRDNYLQGKRVNTQKLWHVLMFEMWYEKWM